MSLFQEKPRKASPAQGKQKPSREASGSPAKSALFASDDEGDDTDVDEAAPMASKTGGKARAVGGGQHDQWWQRNQELLNPVVLTILSAMTRFYRIGKSNFVVWDEAHFGKFGAHYVNHTFYHDVHPPLAKMLVGLSEILTGFDGSFTFPSGETYPENVNYRFLRIFNASFGVPLAPFAYVTLRNLGCSMNAALLGGLLVCFDNALCTISRFILLDAMLLCFTAMSAMCLSGIYKHRKQPFTVPWYKWMFMTGVSLGLVTSSKWVGFFAVALVGLYTVYELYDLLELPETRPSNYLMHWLVRGAALIVIPVAIYLACFKVHFALLYKSGPGDAEMDSLFQANLQGTNLQNQPLDVAFGSKVTIKNALQGVGLLHSHVDQYPGGSQQQQITCYGHKDSNNDWILKKVHGQTYGNTSETVEFIKNGDIVRLVHERTTRNLHSHQVKAHVAKREWEVTGYGMDSKWNDPNDHWRVEVVQDLSHSNPNKHLRTLASRFRLRHVQQGCLLRASGKSLPQWGWKQAEIVCDRSGKIDDNSVWNIENHVNPLLPNARPGELRSSFLRDFVRLNKAMARTNNALLPDPDKFDSLTSAPYEWPIMRLGLRMCGWNDNRVKFWLTGNPVVWWLSSLAVFIAGPIQVLYFAIRSQRGIDDFNGNPGALENYALVSAILWGGWALHYLPFFIMGRVTYLHHYFPAVYFAAMYLAFLLEWNAARLSGSVTSRMNKTVLAVLGLAAIANFMFFAPFTFGFDYPAKELANRKWISTWNIYDGHD